MLRLEASRTRFVCLSVGLSVCLSVFKIEPGGEQLEAMIQINKNIEKSKIEDGVKVLIN